MIPAAPLVGAVTTRPPAAFSSFTASAQRLTQSMVASGSSSAAREQLALPIGGAALDLEAARQHAVGRHAARDAGLHHVPDLEQSGIDLGVTAPMALVGAHHLRDRKAMRAALLEQFVAAVKRHR